LSIKMLWTAKTRNSKTGNVPTAYIGESVKEAWNSCKGCALRDSHRCYAWNGMVNAGFRNILKAYKNNKKRYSLKNALEKLGPTVRMVRVGALGDPARASHATLRRNAQKIRFLGLAFIGYTHHWREVANSKLNSLLMASCETVEQADEAVKKGWRATTIVPWDHKGKRFITPAGNQALVCPAQTTAGMTCNTCRLCDADRKTNFSVIAFKDHGPQVRNKIRAAKKLPIV